MGFRNIFLSEWTLLAKSNQASMVLVVPKLGSMAPNPGTFLIRYIDMVFQARVVLG